VPFQNSIKLPTKQKGLVLVVFVIIIVLAFISYIVGDLSLSDIKSQRDLETSQALKKAKQALIAYAVNYPKDHAPRGPGYLLCPDIDNDGVEETSCNGLTTIGRLPWFTLGVGDLRDSDNERLWYAVSENFDFTASPVTVPLTRKVLNTATEGNITVRDSNNNIVHDGTIMNAAVAVIIAPGRVITRDDGVVQNRSSATDKLATINYLDIDTVSGEDNADFIQDDLNGFIKGEIEDGAGDVIVNDRIAVITYGDIMKQVHRRVANEISNVLNNYFLACGKYPEASLFDPTKADSDFDSGSTPSYFGHIPTDNDGMTPPVPATVTPFNWNTGCAAGINLPVWFWRENWHRETYYHFSAGNPCAGVNCLVVNNTIPPVNEAEAIIVFSGRILNLARPINNIGEYFEGENSDGDNIYDANEVNDYVWVVAQ